jgi:phosphopantetheinyl transferase
MATHTDAIFAVAQQRRTADTPAARSSAKALLRRELSRILGQEGLSASSEFLVISYSHLSDETWAAATTTPCRLGIDAARETEFAHPYPLHKVFHPEELAAGRPPACLWAMKEAVVKALGCGFDGMNPLDIRIATEAGVARIGREEPCVLHIWSHSQGTGAWIAAAYANLAEMAAEKKEGKSSLCME